MKKIFKFMVNFFACVMLALTATSFAACEDIKKMEITVQLYNYSDSVFYEEKDVKITVDLYRHLAPKTVDYFTELADSGFYNGAVFYKISDRSSQINVGDFKFDGETLSQNLLPDGKTPSEIYGEFEKNGTTGSNLQNVKGSIGMWHSWYASSGSNTYKTSSDARNSGKGTFYIPTSSISSYDGYFCVFATIDTSITANATALSALSSVFESSARSSSYVVFFTGEYDENKPQENYGLTFNAVSESEFDRGYSSDEETYNGEKIFVAEGDQLVDYNRKTVYVPNVQNGSVAAVIKSVKIK